MAFFLLLFLLAVEVRSDAYVDEVQHRCDATHRTYLCTKYKVFKYIQDYQLSNVSLTGDKSIRLVSLPKVDNTTEVDVQFYGRSRQYHQRDSEMVKIVKFLKRRVVKFLKEQALSLSLPEGTEIVEEVDEGRGLKGKKKKMLLLPILILLKVFKIKVLASLILVGVVVIKKMLLTAAFILPGVVAAIKHHCKAQQLHVVPYNSDDEHHISHEHEGHEELGYGGYGYGISSYGGEKNYWDKRKRYSSYH